MSYDFGSPTGRIDKGEPELQYLPAINRAQHGTVTVVGDYSEVEIRVMANLIEKAQVIDSMTANCLDWIAREISKHALNDLIEFSDRNIYATHISRKERRKPTPPKGYQPPAHVTRRKRAR